MDTVFLIVSYLAVAYASGKVGEKFQVGVMWQYFIPIYGIILICRCARVSPWWLLGLFVPLLNLAVVVYVYGSLARQLGKNFWLNGLGALVFCLPIFFMAWDSSRPVQSLPPGLPPINKE
ncbi:MAG TPA: DUF5684 domain-containing protein [Patescibacteria group bacterium]|nr:DUF5684 domain-containing protein [Patescibacteria group bacterium]